MVNRGLEQVEKSKLHWIHILSPAPLKTNVFGPPFYCQFVVCFLMLEWSIDFRFEQLIVKFKSIMDKINCDLALSTLLMWLLVSEAPRI